MVLRVNPITGRFIPHCCCPKPCDDAELYDPCPTIAPERQFSCLFVKFEAIKLGACFGNCGEGSYVGFTRPFDAAPIICGDTGCNTLGTHLPDYMLYRWRSPLICEDSNPVQSHVAYEVVECDCASDILEVQSGGSLAGTSCRGNPGCGEGGNCPDFDENRYWIGQPFLALEYLDATTIQVVLFVRLTLYSIPVDHADRIAYGWCTYWTGVYHEIFRGTATIPTGWIDSSGLPTEPIAVSNDYVCADVGTVIGPVCGGEAVSQFAKMQQYVLGAEGTITLGVDEPMGWPGGYALAMGDGGFAGTCSGPHALVGEPCDSGDPDDPPVTPPGGGVLPPGGGGVPPPPPPPPVKPPTTEYRFFQLIDCCDQELTTNWIELPRNTPITGIKIGDTCYSLHKPGRITRPPSGDVIPGDGGCEATTSLPCTFLEENCGGCDCCPECDDCDHESQPDASETEEDTQVTSFYPFTGYSPPPINENVPCTWTWTDPSSSATIKVTIAGEGEDCRIKVQLITSNTWINLDADLTCDGGHWVGTVPLWNEDLDGEEGDIFYGTASFG